MATKYTPDSRLADVRVRGAKLHANIREATSTASIALSTTSPTTMNLTIDDPLMTLTAGGLLSRGAAIDYVDLEMVIRSSELDDPGSGPVVTVTARSEAWVRLKTQRGARAWRHTDPASVVRGLGRTVGLKVIAQSSGKRRRITRGKKESSLGLIERYASEMGFLSFISAGTLYFGSPKWLTRNGAKRTLRWDRNRRTGTVSAGGALVQMPAMRRSEDSPRGQAEMTAMFLGDGSDSWRPGHVIELHGIPSYTGDYLVTDVQIPGDHNSPVVVTASIPQSLKGADGDVPPAREVRAGSGKTGELVYKQMPPAPAMTDAALTYAVGAAGVVATAAAIRPFTGAEMVEWCAARAGVTLVGEPAQMLAYCRLKKSTVDVEPARKIRGALLFTDDRVGIVIGTDRVVMAQGRSYAVVAASSIDWTAAAVVPGLKYGRR